MTYREEEAQTSAFLSELRTRWPQAAELRDLQIGPLEEADACRLALAHLGSTSESAQRISVSFAHESGGNPFLIEELAHSAASSRAPSTGTGSRPSPP